MGEWPTAPAPTRLTSDQVAWSCGGPRAGRAGRGPGDVDGYDSRAVEEAAREVGLSPPRCARRWPSCGWAPCLRPVPTAGRPGGAVRLVCHQRLVEITPMAAHAHASSASCAPRCSSCAAIAGDRAIYRARSDLVASLRRGLDFGGAIKLDGLRTITVVATPADERTLVRVEAELTISRANAVAGGAALGTGGPVHRPDRRGVRRAGPGGGGPCPAGMLVGGGSVRVAESRWRKRRDDVAEVLDSLLDRL